MKLTIAIIAIGLLAQCQWVEACDCCLPTKLEAEVYFVETKMTTHFVADYSKQWVFLTDDREGNEFNLFDLASGKVYYVDKEGCRFHHSERVRQFQQCTGHEDSEPQRFLVGKQQFSGYRTEENDLYTYQLMMSSGETCLPVMSQAKFKTFTETILYSRVNATISNWKTDVRLRKCVEEDSPHEYYG